MATSRKATYLILALGLLGGLVAVWAPKTPPGSGRLKDNERAARGPARPPGLGGAPPEVREFLGRVLEELSKGGAGVTGYQFRHWEREGKPTHEALGIKAIPGVDPREVIARVMDVDGYEGHIAHVEACRSLQDPAPESLERVHFFQRVSVPGVAKVQQELVLVDAGTIEGYRVAYWYLLGPETEALDPEAGARSEFNVGAWLVAPGVVGYALSTWPRRGDVNVLQWVLLTSGADGLAKKVVEGNIDGMAAWAKERRECRAGPSMMPLLMCVGARCLAPPRQLAEDADQF